MSDLVGNPEARFSRVAAHVIAVYSFFVYIATCISFLKGKKKVEM